VIGPAVEQAHQRGRAWRQAVSPSPGANAAAHRRNGSGQIVELGPAARRPGLAQQLLEHDALSASRADIGSTRPVSRPRLRAFEGGSAAWDRTDRAPPRRAGARLAYGLPTGHIIRRPSRELRTRRQRRHRPPDWPCATESSMVSVLSPRRDETPGREVPKCSSRSTPSGCGRTFPV